MRKAGPATIICVHGAGGGGWEWAIWARVLAARGHGVVAPDLRSASAGIAVTRYADYRRQVADWVSGATVDGIAPVLVGASLGGLLALDVASTSAVAALVLVNPMPPAPLASRLPSREWPDVVAWGSQRSLAGTREAMPDADDAACLYAFRRWRDESGAVLREVAAGIAIEPPGVPVLCIASAEDRDVPSSLTRELADALDADRSPLHAASHVGPLLGRAAARCAERTADWIAGLPSR